MDPILDHEATVALDQLCGVCETIVDFYLNNWDVFEELGSAQAPRSKSKLEPTTDCPLEPYSTFRKHHASVDSMRSAAAQGCHLCSLFMGDSSFIPRERTDQQLYVETCRSSKPGMVYWKLRTVGLTSWSLGNRVHLEKTLYDSTREARALDSTCRENALADLKRSAGSTISTGSPALRKMIAHWLRQCIGSHKSCNERLDHGAPTRLLDLDAFAECKDLRLVFTADTSVQEYAALSYCWGNRVTTTLRNSNLVDFVSRIPLALLPKTVVEAIEVCRGLDIRYLWVDALCIVQEDSEDFAQEVSRMGSIYAGSLVTIAAADSVHCESGLYRSRMPLSDTDLVVMGSDATFTFGSGPAHEHEDHIYSLQVTPLTKRGWAFQERVMAPRTIHFDRDKIVWECRERTLCPRCTDESNIGISHEGQVKRIFTDLLQSSTITMTRISIQGLWVATLEAYTRTNLSDENDRLSALAGIAQLISQRFGYEASHGLWLPFFEGELLWYIQESKRENSRHEAHRANIPSWARPVGPNYISYASKLEKSERALYNCTFTMLPRPTPFGQLSSLQPASFKVRGWLTPCRVVFNPFQEYKLRKVLWKLFERTEHSVPSVLPWIQPHDSKGGPWKLNFYPDRIDMAEQDVVCITLHRNVGDAQGERRTWGWTADHGLVLCAVNTDQKVYRRIGYFEAYLGVKQEWAQEEEEVEIV